MCDIPGGNIPELSTADWKRVIRDASSLGAQTIVFSGGEPLLREDIFELISFTKKNNLSACVTSNGNLLDEQAAAKLRAAEVNVVNISIEGTKKTHDFLRGAGSFDKALAALANLKKYKIESTAASTVSKYNYEELLDVLEIARDCGATTIRLQPFNVIFLKDRERKGEFLIGQQDIQKLEGVIKKFIDLSREYKISTNPASYLSRIPGYLAGKKFFTRNCGALWYSCPINPNGDVFPCWIEGADNKLIGNVREENLYRLWLSEKRARIVGEITSCGCNGCLMSCYDEVFDRPLSKEYLAGKAKKIKKAADYKKVLNKLRQSLKSQVVKSKLRYRFYISYRSSLFNLLKRRLLGIFRKPKKTRLDLQAEKEKALSETRVSKNRLKKTIQSL
jgi:radical SAM protein with 4Fe4S-binding SPASM domain